MWAPPHNIVNYAPTIEALNTMITEQNEKDKVSYVGLRLLGMKYFKSGNKQHKFDTAPGAKQIWRELRFLENCTSPKNRNSRLSSTS